jgi:hypothetical protein
MPDTQKILESFTGGIVCPEMYKAVSNKKFGSMLSAAQNVRIGFNNSIQTRNSLLFKELDQLAYQTVNAKLIPLYNDAYGDCILEFYNNNTFAILNNECKYIRELTGEKRLISHPFTIEESADLKYSQIADVLYVVDGIRIWTIRRTGIETFVSEAYEYDVPPLRSENKDITKKLTIEGGEAVNTYQTSDNFVVGNVQSYGAISSTNAQGTVYTNFKVYAGGTLVWTSINQASGNFKTIYEILNDFNLSAYAVANSIKAIYTYNNSSITFYVSRLVTDPRLITSMSVTYDTYYKDRLNIFYSSEDQKAVFLDKTQFAQYITNITASQNCEDRYWAIWWHYFDLYPSWSTYSTGLTASEFISREDWKFQEVYQGYNLYGGFELGIADVEPNYGAYGYLDAIFDGTLEGLLTPATDFFHIIYNWGRHETYTAYLRIGLNSTGDLCVKIETSSNVYMIHGTKVQITGYDLATSASTTTGFTLRTTSTDATENASTGNGVGKTKRIKSVGWNFFGDGWNASTKTYNAPKLKIGEVFAIKRRNAGGTIDINQTTSSNNKKIKSNGHWSLISSGNWSGDFSVGYDIGTGEGYTQFYRVKSNNADHPQNVNDFGDIEYDDTFDMSAQYNAQGSNTLSAQLHTTTFTVISYFKVVAYDDDNACICDVIYGGIDDDYATDDNGVFSAAPDKDYVAWYYPAWSDYEGYPKIVAAFQNRLVFANTRRQPMLFWTSKSNALGTYRIFPEYKDDDPITMSVLSDKSDQIQNILVKSDMIVFTKGKEISISGGSLFTQANKQANIQSNVGSDIATNPTIAQNRILFLPYNKKWVTEINYHFEETGYVPNSLTYFVEHLFGRVDYIVTMEYNQNYSELICLMKSGNILVMKYIPQLGVYSWNTYKHAIGTITNICYYNDKNRNGNIALRVKYSNGNSYIETFDLYEQDRTMDCKVEYNRETSATNKNLNRENNPYFQLDYSLQQTSSPITSVNTDQEIATSQYPVNTLVYSTDPIHYGNFGIVTDVDGYANSSIVRYIGNYYITSYNYYKNVTLMLADDNYCLAQNIVKQDPNGINIGSLIYSADYQRSKRVYIVTGIKMSDDATPVVLGYNIKYLCDYNFYWAEMPQYCVFEDYEPSDEGNTVRLDTTEYDIYSINNIAPTPADWTTVNIGSILFLGSEDTPLGFGSTFSFSQRSGDLYCSFIKNIKDEPTLNPIPFDFYVFQMPFQMSSGFDIVEGSNQYSKRYMHNMPYLLIDSNFANAYIGMAIPVVIGMLTPIQGNVNSGNANNLKSIYKAFVTFHSSSKFMITDQDGRVENVQKKYFDNEATDNDYAIRDGVAEILIENSYDKQCQIMFVQDKPFNLKISNVELNISMGGR